MIFAPSCPTAGGNTLDYFVVAERFAHCVAGVARVCDRGGRPHHPVRLFLRPSPRHALVRVLRKPCRLGPLLPHGPLPVQSDSGALGGGDGAALDEGYRRVFRRMEAELQSVGVAGGGVGVQAARSREDGPCFVWQAAAGRRMQGCANLDDHLALRWTSALALANDMARCFRREHCRCAALGCGAPHRTDHDRPRPPNPQEARTAERARRRLLHLVRCPPAELAAHEADKIRAWACAFLDAAHCKLCTALEQLLVLARSELDAANRSHVQRARSQWHEHIQGSSSAALGRQHRYTRAVMGWIPNKVAAIYDRGSVPPRVEEADKQWREARVRCPELDSALATPPPCSNRLS